MASRPVFFSKESYPYFEEEDVEFVFHSGFALSQKQKNIAALHKAFQEKHVDRRIIEISSKSTELLGTQLSAFNVMYNLNGSEVSLESIFQGSKVFENAGPFHDIYKMGPVEAKKDPRIRESGIIIGFSLDGKPFPSDPKDFFYNWIYSSAIYEHNDLLEKLSDYDAFTDIEFNPKKSLNCQARTVAILRGLIMSRKLDEAMDSPESYLKTVYHVDNIHEPTKQLSLFD